MDWTASISTETIGAGAILKFASHGVGRQLAAGDIIRIEHPDGSSENVTVAAVSAASATIETAGGNGQYLIMPDDASSVSWTIKEQIHQGS